MCELCGYSPSEVGRAETCREAFDELSAYTLCQPRPPFIHQLAVDAYSSQHLEDAQSSISLLFGLMGLCMVIERGATGLEVQLAHMSMATRKDRAAWPKPPIRPHRYTMNVGHVLDSSPGVERDDAIRQWCKLTWEAMPETHNVVREFCQDVN